MLCRKGRYSLTRIELFKTSSVHRHSCIYAGTFLNNRVLGILDAVSAKDACTNDYEQAWPESIGRKGLTLEACVDSKKRMLTNVHETLGNIRKVGVLTKGGPTPTSKKAYDEHERAEIEPENILKGDKLLAVA